MKILNQWIESRSFIQIGVHEIVQVMDSQRLGYSFCNQSFIASDSLFLLRTNGAMVHSRTAQQAPLVVAFLTELNIATERGNIQGG